MSGIPSGQHRLRLDVQNYQHYEETIDLAAGPNVKSIALVAQPNSGNVPTIAQSDSAKSNDAARAALTFEVGHPHGWTVGAGHLQVSALGLTFREDGPHARPEYDFSAPCSSIKKVSANGGRDAVRGSVVAIRLEGRALPVLYSKQGPDSAGDRRLLRQEVASTNSCHRSP